MSGLISGLVGIQTQAAQPAVLAYNSGQDTDVTGDGTSVTVDFDTEVFDQNGDFLNDTFTAPVTGRYLVTATVQISGLTNVADLCRIKLDAANRHLNRDIDAGTRTQPFFNRSLDVTSIIDMDASDTVIVSVLVSGEGSKVTDINGGTEIDTSVSVLLVA